MNELETKIINWKKEEAKWATVAVQMQEVQVYGVTKFLNEKLVLDLDDNILYVCKKNIEWKNSVVQQAYGELAKLMNHIVELITSMQNDLKYIRIKCIKEDDKTIENLEVITESFERKINYMKEAKALVSNDLSTTAKIESLLFLCIEHLGNHANRVEQVRKEKEVWKQRIVRIGLPHSALIQNFSAAHVDWKNAIAADKDAS